MYEIDFYVFVLKTDYSYLWFLYKSDLRSSLFRKIEIIRIEHFLSKKNDVVIYNINQMPVSGEPFA